MRSEYFIPIERLVFQNKFETLQSNIQKECFLAENKIGFLIPFTDH